MQHGVQISSTLTVIIDNRELVVHAKTATAMVTAQRGALDFSVT